MARHKDTPKARAETYKSSGKTEQEQEQKQKREESRQGPRDLDEWEDIVGRRIEEAMQQGAFDNLPGKGKPLNLNREPFVPDDQQMAFKLLKNNDLTPGWIGDRKALELECERWRRTMRATVNQHLRMLAQAQDQPARHAVRRSWRFYISQWTEQIRTLNKEILTLNLSLPAVSLELFQLRLDEEVDKAGGGPLLQALADLPDDG